tara:strand:+ start:7771 stop:7995 length:225 start_codon:yes stop_codon:yes gene_type:complete
MDTDLVLVVGIIIGVLAIPSMLSTISDSRPPRAAAVLVLIAGVLIVVAVQKRPNGYSINEIPQAFITVIGRYLY